MKTSFQCGNGKNAMKNGNHRSQKKLAASMPGIASESVHNNNTKGKSEVSSVPPIVPGLRVSKVVDIVDKKNQDAVDRDYGKSIPTTVLNLIGRVHNWNGYACTSKLQIKYINDDEMAVKGADGYIYGTAVCVSRTRNPSTRAATLVHELGHGFDALVASHTGEFASTNFRKAKPGSPERKLWDAISSSKAYKGLQLAESKATTPGGKAYYKYLSDPHELFARAYVNYIANKTKHPIFKEYIETHAKKYKQWHPKDFDPIEKAFDEFMKTKKLA
jgi:hypothetical protein